MCVSKGVMVDKISASDRQCEPQMNSVSHGSDCRGQVYGSAMKAHHSSSLALRNSVPQYIMLKL